MRKILFLFTIILFVSCSEKQEATFVIQGTVKDFNTNKLILFQENDIEREISTPIDTIYLDESGSFSADFNNEPHFYTLVVSKDKQIPLAINKGQKITIEVNKSETKVTGSTDTDLLIAYEKFRMSSLERLVNSVRKQISTENKLATPNRKKIDSLDKLELKNYDLHLGELNKFIKENLETSIALYPTSLRWKGEENIALFDTLSRSFEKEHSNLKITKKLKEKVTRIQQTVIGGTVPDIASQTSDEKTVTLFSVKKKYTLIDFWASWCGPCRRESTILNTLYKKHSASGFEIYGISLDTNKRQWLNALKKDNRIWTNVSSLEGFKTPAAYDFTVTALPMNYLIDGNGKIIAKNLHGYKLEKFVSRLFEK